MKTGTWMPGSAIEPTVSPTAPAVRRNRVWSAIGRSIGARFFTKTRSGAESALRIEDKITLGPKMTLCLVACREREFLVATGADAMVTMLEVSGSEKTRPARAAPPRAQKRGGPTR